MRRQIINLVGILGLLTLANCGGGGSITLPEKNSTLPQLQLQFFDTYVAASYPGGKVAYRTIPQGSNPSGNAVNPNVSLNDGAPEGAAQQGQVTGVVQGPTGAVTIEARSAVACDAGFCIDDSRLPLAVVQSNTPGFYSIVIPHHGEQIILNATLNGNASQVYVGALSGRKDHVDFNF